MRTAARIWQTMLGGAGCLTNYIVVVDVFATDREINSGERAKERGEESGREDIYM